MALREKAQKTIAEAAGLRQATDEAFLYCMRTELKVIHTMCLLAEQEDGAERAHHIQQAEKALVSALEIVKRVGSNQEDRDAIKEARHNIRRLGGRDFSQPHD